MITRKGYEVKVECPVLLDDKSNIKDFFVADVHGGRSFLLNDGGYPMNDVDMIIRQQDANIRESMLAQLQEVPTTGFPADMPNQEVLMGLRSRYQQAPSEMVNFYEKQLEIAQAKYEAAQAAAAEKSSEVKVDANEVIDNAYICCP